MLLYLVLYLQDVLGYSALRTGLRLLFLSGGVLLSSGAAGRLSAKVPARALIGRDWSWSAPGCCSCAA